MEISYWSKVLGRRTTRRRTMVGAGGAALGAAFLAACGGSSDEPQESSGLLTKPTDTSKSARRGGTFKFFTDSDVATFEPHVVNITNQKPDTVGYQTLLRVKPTMLEQADLGDVIGDALESWEFSPDKLTMTMKLRANNKFDARAPTNGRTMDSSDVLYSFERYAATGAFRLDIFNSANPNAPVSGVSATDSRTIVMKMNKPFPDIQAIFAQKNSGSFYMVPKEAEGGFDPRREQRGSGPFVMSEYATGVRYVYDRNPNYWDTANVNIDKIEFPVITEYAAGLAQLKAGNLYQYVVRSEDVLQTKQDVPEMLLLQKIAFNGPSPYLTLFGWADGDGSPFRDQRVRQAYSLGQDRDLFIDAIFNTEKLAASGVAIDSAWSTSALSANLPYHVDPRSKDFGPNAKWYKRDIAEAKKLLSAAGFPNGLDVVGHTIGSGNPFGPNYQRQVEVQSGMPADAGIRVNYTPHDWTTEFIPRYRDTGKFDGVSFTSIFVPTGSGRNGLYSVFNTNGGSYRHWSKSGKSTFDGDPFLNELTNKLIVEFDNDKARDLALELQKYESEYQYQPRIMGAAKTLDLAAQQAIANWNVWDQDGWYLTLWVDDQKAPIKRA